MCRSSIDANPLGRLPSTEDLALLQSQSSVPSHTSQEMTDLSMYKTATMATSAIVMIGLHTRLYTEERVSVSDSIDTVSPFSKTSTAWYFVVVATFVFVLALSWKERKHEVLREIFPMRNTGFVKPSEEKHVAFSNISRVTSVDTIKNFSKSLLHSLDSCTLRAALQAITRKECFARSDYIERLSASDLATLFQYAQKANLVGFDKDDFLSGQSQTTRAIVTAMDTAVKVSRGCAIGARKVGEGQRIKGDVDALYFVAAARIFAEWRTLRLVPPGYQRYAVALSLGYRDLLQNLEKIESSVHQYLAYHQDSLQNGARVSSPTFHQLLEYEIQIDLHKKLPHLSDKSAASGLLWTKRQLQYQVITFSNSLQVPALFPTAKEAASAAYRSVYDEYHGWAVRKIFSHSFGGSPPLDDIWTNLEPPQGMPGDYKETNIRCVAETLNSYAAPGRSLSDVSSDSRENEESEKDMFLSTLDKVNKVLVEKWEDMLRLFNCGTEEKKKYAGKLILSSDSHFDLSALNASLTNCESMSRTIFRDQAILMETSNPVERSKRNVADFVGKVSPMIEDLGEMIDHFDMNDPSRV